MTIFEFVKSRFSILDVVLDYVPLKQAGNYWKGSCPFHHETDASFTVSPDKQIFYCFGCHIGGDLISFIAKSENLSQIEAVQHLIEKYNVEIPEEIKSEFARSAGKNSEKGQFFTVCEAVADWAHKQLLASNIATSYLKQRQIAIKEINFFQIGYFPSGSRFLNKLLKDMSQLNILVKDLIDVGVVADGKVSMYSPFEERILFPIRDALGRCCGFGGRIFQPNDQRAKYYNSRESEWFLKGKLLFSLDKAKKEMQYTGKAFLVEGYTDCVAMVQYGFKNTVATLGTACTSDHLKVLARYIKKLYVLYDGDAAGQKAILRLTELCWVANLDLEIIRLPEKEDPASFLNRGGDLQGLIDRSSDIFTFFVDSLGNQFWGKSLSEKIALCEKIIRVIAKIHDRFKQDLLLQQASSVMQMPFESLKQLLSRHKDVSAGHKEVVCQNKNVHGDDRVVLIDAPAIEEQIVSLVVNSISSETLLCIEKDLLPYFSSPMQSILKKTEVFIDRQNDDTPRTFDNFLNSFGSSVEKDWVIQQSFMLHDEAPQRLFEKLLFRFRKRNWKRIVQDIKKRIFEAKQQNKADELQKLLSSFLNLKQEMKDRGLI